MENTIFPVLNTGLYQSYLAFETYPAQTNENNENGEQFP
ncbi:Thioesterase [Bacillus thuringiensis IBL 4222]|nr:Thioesterase [Bacillus thuringiensis IBL 4222]